MNPTPEDRALAATFATVMDAGDDNELARVIAEDSTPDAHWEAAYLLVALARRAGWEPSQKPLTE